DRQDRPRRERERDGVGKQRHWCAGREVPATEKHHDRERDQREEELHEDMRREDDYRRQRRGTQALEDSALAVDGDDGDERRDRAERHQNRRQHGQHGRYGATGLNRGARYPRSDETTRDHEDDHGYTNRAEHTHRLAHENLGLEPRQLEQRLHFPRSSISNAQPPTPKKSGRVRLGVGSWQLEVDTALLPDRVPR